MLQVSGRSRSHLLEESSFEAAATDARDAATATQLGGAILVVPRLRRPHSPTSLFAQK